MLIQGNNVPATDIIDTYSQGGELTKHELLSILSLPQDETFISPDKLVQLKKYSDNFFKWHRYAFSGRSFSKGFSHEDKLYELMIKGGHLLKNGEIYDPKITGMYAPPAWGSETVPQLFNEFTAAYDIQNLSLQATGELAPIPIPLKVSRLDKYRYKGELEEYELLLAYIFGTNSTHYNNMFNVMAEEGLEVYDKHPHDNTKAILKEEFKSFEQCFDMYWKNLGPHGSYQYICQGTNMRLADVFKLPTQLEMQQSIRSFYPGLSDEEICQTFMNNLGKAWGTIYGAGYYFKPGTSRISSCYPVDTTIMGHVMDIDGYEYCNNVDQDEIINILKKHWLYAEMSYLFYHVFFANNFFDFYKTHFIPSYVDTYMEVGTYRLAQEGKEFNIDGDKKLARDQLCETHYNHAHAYITENVLGEKKLWSEEKYLGNILEVIGLM